MKILDFIKSKGLALLGAVLAIVTSVGAIWARGRKLGQLEQKVASEDAEDKAREQLDRVRAEEDAKRRARSQRLAGDLAYKAKEIEDRRRTAPNTAAAAKKETAASRERARLASLRNASNRRKP